ADNFDSPVFPVLANIYFESGDMPRARKVCEIGLEHHPQSSEGKYILAKIELIDGNLTQAEKYLKEILETSHIHLNAMKLLVEVQTELGRSVKTIGATVNKIVDIVSDDEESLEWLEKNKEELSNSENDISVDEQKSEPGPKTHPKTKSMGTQDNGIVIDSRMATMTLARVFKRQKNYLQALSVLDIVLAKGGDAKKIEKEREEIYKLIKEQESHS
ncbi:MAG: tetratricopeptide repeat protein, partial [Fidelibacterota bacterium]